MKKNILCLLLVAILFLSSCSVTPVEPGDATAESTAPPTTAVQETEPTAPTETDTTSATESQTGTQPETEPEPSAFPEALSLVSGQAFVYDVNAGALLAMKGAGEQLYPASTTKLLTILTAMKYLAPESSMTPGNEQTLVGEGSTIAYVNSNHTLSAEMLIEGMLLPSGNDAAYALAAAAGRAISGDETSSGLEGVAVFMEEMNRYAQELGMSGSHFVTPDGYYDDDHYTTVEDMATVAILAAQNELICRYSGLYEDDVVYLSGHTNHWINTNLMLDPSSRWYNPYVTGLKTGSLSNYYSLICTLEKDGQAYIAGVFSAPDNTTRYADMTAIADWLLAD